MQDLSKHEGSDDVQGRLRGLYRKLVEGDVFEGVGSDETLMRIHATAEEFDQAAEECHVPFQVGPECLLHSVTGT